MFSYLHWVPGDGVGPEVHHHLSDRADVSGVVEDNGIVAGRRAQEIRLYLVEFDMVHRVHAPLEGSEIPLARNTYTHLYCQRN